MAEGYEVEGVWRARGRGLRMAVIEPPGVVVHLTGQVAWDAEERIVGRSDPRQQTRQCLANIEALQAHVGGGLDDVVSLTTHFVDRAHLPAIQRARAEAFGPEGGPASTSVMVAGLGHEDFLVELTPVAVVPPERFRAPG